MHHTDKSIVLICFFIIIKVIFDINKGFIQNTIYRTDGMLRSPPLPFLVPEDSSSHYACQMDKVHFKCGLPCAYELHNGHHMWHKKQTRHGQLQMLCICSEGGRGWMFIMRFIKIWIFISDDLYILRKIFYVHVVV